MLAGDFYIINSFQNQDNNVSVMLELDAAHEIFGGIFPAAGCSRGLHDANNKRDHGAGS
jgi:hypothetical protein